jgi:hypothetical protein
MQPILDFIRRQRHGKLRAKSLKRTGKMLMADMLSRLERIPKGENQAYRYEKSQQRVATGDRC